MSGLYTFGYGSKDVEGAQLASRFICNHIYCSKSQTKLICSEDDEEHFIYGGMRIVLTDDIPDGYENAEHTEDKNLE